MNLFKLNRNVKLEKYLNKLYYKCGQRLYLHSEYVEEESIKKGTYFDQEIFVAEYSKEMFEKDLEKEAKRLCESDEHFEIFLSKEAKRLGVSLEELKLTHDIELLAKDNSEILLEELKLSHDSDNFVSFYDKYLFTIQTLDSVMLRNYADLGKVPYYQVKDWERLITVQKFGQLTDEDIFFAIEYFLNRVIECWAFNIRYNDRSVHVDLKKWRPDYKKDNPELKSKKYWTEKKYPGVWI